VVRPSGGGEAPWGPAPVANIPPVGAHGVTMLKMPNFPAGAPWLRPQEEGLQEQRGFRSCNRGSNGGCRGRNGASRAATGAGGTTGAAVPQTATQPLWVGESQPTVYPRGSACNQCWGGLFMSRGWHRGRMSATQVLWAVRARPGLPTDESTSGESWAEVRRSRSQQGDVPTARVLRPAGNGGARRGEEGEGGGAGSGRRGPRCVGQSVPLGLLG